MASGWGNAFSSLGESFDRRAQLKREDAIRAQEQADKDRQFKLMMDQFLADKQDREQQRHLQTAGIAAQNMVPDSSGSAGSISLDDPRLAAVKGTPYDRSSQGMTLPSKSTVFDPQTGQPSVTQNTPKPTGKFVWNPSWEQQQAIDARQEHLADTASNRAFQTSERTATEGFQAGQQKSQQAFLAAEQAKQLANVLKGIQMQLGPKLSTQQTIGIHLLEQATKSLDPDEQKKLRTQAFSLLGIPDPMATSGQSDEEKAVAAAAGAGGGGFHLPSMPNMSMPDMSRFLGSPNDNTVENPAPSMGAKKLSWDDIDQYMRRNFPGSGNWNPLTMGRDVPTRR